METDYVGDNVLFYYIPCSLRRLKRKTLSNVRTIINGNGSWEQQNICVNRFYRFIANKLQGTPNSRGYSLYHLKDNCDSNKWMLNKRCQINNPKSTGNEVCKVVGFVINDIYLLLFDGSVFFVIFQITFEEKSSLRDLANSIYFIKKPDGAQITIKGKESRIVTPLSMVKGLLSELFIKQEITYDVLFYADEKYSRANFLLMKIVTDNSTKEKLEYYLYYLKNGFNEKYQRIEDDCSDYYGPNGQIWGISSEASVCIETISNLNVIKKQFYEFKTQYFMMYSLLLYQKYTYFYFLTLLSNKKHRKIAELKKYKAALADFERDYVFSVITDIPQSKTVYELMFNRLKITDLYSDVKEPIDELNERAKNSHSRRLEIIGGILSALGIVSIIADGKQVLDMVKVWQIKGILAQCGHLLTVIFTTPVILIFCIIFFIAICVWMKKQE